MDWPPGMRDGFPMSESGRAPPFNSVANAFAYHGMRTLARVADARNVLRCHHSAPRGDASRWSCRGPPPRRGRARCRVSPWGPEMWDELPALPEEGRRQDMWGSV